MLVIISRFTWELPQVFLGFILCFITNLFGETDSIKFTQGRLMAYVNFMNPNSGISLSCFIIVGSNSNETIVSHEFGHTIQSQYTGWFYLPIIGIPSFLRASVFKLMWSMGYFKSVNYESIWFEKQATQLGKKYYKTI